MFVVLTDCCFVPRFTPFLHAAGVSISMMSLFPVAVAGLPSFAGVKFVSSDNGDFFALNMAYGSTLSLMFAPEPKLQGVGLGAQVGFCCALVLCFRRRHRLFVRLLF